MKAINIIIIAVVSIFLASCTKGKQEEVKENKVEEQSSESIELTQEQIKTVGITLGKVENRPLNNVVRANGELQLNPQDMADVTSLVGGVVRKIYVTEGQQVKAGQVVAHIENTEIVGLQKDYLIAVKETGVTHQELLRQKTLASQKAGVEKTLQQASAAYEMALARQTGLYNQLRQIGINTNLVKQGKIIRQVSISAPISGIVTKISVKSGSYIESSQSLMQVANNAAVFCNLNVFERNISQVAKGQEVDFVITNSPKVHFKGTVKEINRSMDSDTKAISVHVGIDAKNATELIPGMYVTGIISMGKQNVPALPDDAIVNANGKQYVFVLDKRHKEGNDVKFQFKQVEVVAGVSELGYTQVDFVTPISKDATVVTSNAFYIASMTADHGEE